jgi:hypothetical protein
MTGVAGGAVRGRTAQEPTTHKPPARPVSADEPARSGRPSRPGGMPADATVSRSSRRSPARATVMVVGAVIVGVIVVVLAVTVLGKGSSGTSNSPAVTSSSSASAGTHHAHTIAPHGESSSPTVSAAETQVAVINGTGTAGLAHRLSASLQQSGYSQATPLDGAPPGTRQTTVVEYASGHRAEAAGVAHAVGVSQVQPMEASVSPLVGGSTVVVVAGLDKATPADAAEATSGAGTASPSSPSSNEAVP